MEQSENDLRETLSYTVERYSTLLKKNGVNVLYDFQNEPVMFTYDEKSIERAFQNLLSNAVRYAKDEIKVSCREMDGRIVVSVADNGKGIKEDELPRIFDRFYKGENGVHGIGLSIVKSIVNSYGGRIEVETGPGGTVFTVFFATVKK
jgi:signal transduction histidine kinase